MVADFLPEPYPEVGQCMHKLLPIMRPDVAYVIPESGAENRVTVDGRLAVWRTRGAGESWYEASGGLPARAATDLPPVLSVEVS